MCHGKQCRMADCSRFLGGCGMGVLSAVIPIYISEISPAKWRGTFVSFYQLFIVIGILAAYCADFGMISWGNNWRWMLGLPLLFAAGNLLMLLFLPESPRWLIKQGEYEIARKAIARMGISSKDAAVMLETPKSSQKGGPKLSELFRGSTTHIVLLGSLLAVFQQITGINVIINYAPEILRQTGIGGDTALMQAIYVGIVNFLFTIVAVWLVDRLGRKKLLLWGCAGLVVSLAYLTYAFAQPLPGSIGILIALLVYIAFFAVSLSPLMFVVTAEIYPSAIPGYGHGAFNGDQLGLRISGRAVLPHNAGEFRCGNRFCRIRSPLPCCMAVYLHLDSRNQRAFA